MGILFIFPFPFFLLRFVLGFRSSLYRKAVSENKGKIARVGVFLFLHLKENQAKYNPTLSSSFVSLFYYVDSNWVYSILSIPYRVMKKTTCSVYIVNLYNIKAKDEIIVLWVFDYLITLTCITRIPKQRLFLFLSFLLVFFSRYTIFSN